MASLKVVFNDESGTTREVEANYPDSDIELAFSIDANSDGTYGPVYLVGNYNYAAMLAELSGPSSNFQNFARNVLMYDDSEFVAAVNEYIAKAKAVPKIVIPSTNNTYMMPDLSKRIQITENIVYKCTGPGFFYRQHTNVSKEWSGKGGIKVFVSDNSAMTDAVLFLDTNHSSYGHDGQMFPIMPGTNTYISIQYVNYDDVWCLYFVPAYGSSGGLSQIGTISDVTGSAGTFTFTEDEDGDEVPSRLLEILEGTNTSGGGSVDTSTHVDDDEEDTDEPELGEVCYWKIDFGENFVPKKVNSNTGKVTQQPSGTVTSTAEVILEKTVDVDANKSKKIAAEHYQIWRSNLQYAVFNITATSYTKKTTGTNGKTEEVEYNYQIVSVDDVPVNASTYKTVQIKGGKELSPTVVKVEFKLLTEDDYCGDT